MGKKNKILDQVITEGQKNRPELEPSLIDKFFRMISRYFSLVFIKLKFKPNIITTFAIISSIFGGYFLGQGSSSGYTIGALCFFLFLLFDYCDGEMARTLKMHSISGNYLDYFAHFVMFSSFMIGLSYGIYMYHSTSIVLVLGLCGVSGILLGSISDLLISKIIIIEKLREKKKLPLSNKEVEYLVPGNAFNNDNFEINDVSLIRKTIRLLLGPAGGDQLLFFYIPFSVIIYFFPFAIVKKWDMRIIDIYFFYVFTINTLLPFLALYMNIRNKKSEKMYNDIFREKE